MIHGNATAYQSGCRCDKCTVYRFRYSKDYRRRASKSGLQRPPADRARARLVEWQAEGFTASAVAEAANLDPSITRAIMRGANRYVQRANEAAILAVSRADLYRVVSGCTRVPAVGTRRRINALRALGWRVMDIACPAASKSYLADLMCGRITTVSAATYRAIRDRYDQLSMTPGPSDAARRRAAGCPPPLAWDDDDMDDPAARPWKAPAYGQRSAVDPSDLEMLLDSGHSVAQITERLGVQYDSILQQLRRVGADGLHARMVRARKWSA